MPPPLEAELKELLVDILNGVDRKFSRNTAASRSTFQRCIEHFETSVDLGDGAFHSHWGNKMDGLTLVSRKHPWETLRWKVWTKLWVAYCRDPSFEQCTSSGPRSNPSAFKRTVLRLRSTVDGVLATVPVFVPCYESSKFHGWMSDRGKRVVYAMHVWSDAHPVHIMNSGLQPRLRSLPASHEDSATTVLFDDDRRDPYDEPADNINLEHVVPQSHASLFLESDPNNLMLSERAHNAMRGNKPYTFSFSHSGEYYVCRRLRNTLRASKRPYHIFARTSESVHLFKVAHVHAEVDVAQDISATDYTTHIFVPNKVQRAELARKWLYTRVMYTSFFHDLKAMTPRQLAEFDDIVKLAFEPDVAPRDHERRYDYTVALQYDGWHNPLINDTMMRTIRSTHLEHSDNRATVQPPEEDASLLLPTKRILFDARHIRDNPSVEDERRHEAVTHITLFLKLLTHTPDEMRLEPADYERHLNNMLSRSEHPFELSALYDLIDTN